MPIRLLLAFCCAACLPGLDLPRDADGWSQLVPQADSRIVYVSASQGDDATAQSYSASDAAVGADPRQPAGAIAAYASIAAAFEAVRDGEPDWVLLRADDVWEDIGRLPLRSGRGLDAPFVIADYGEGSARPLLRQGNSGGCRSLGNRNVGYLGYLVVAGIHFYNNLVDPADPAYDDSLDPNGSAFNPGHTDIYHIDLEDCTFQFQQFNVQNNGDNLLHDIDFHRCQFLDSYSRSGHSQGLYVKNSDVDVEQCFFDHNGWLIQNGEGLSTEDGVATIFNHNFYVNASYLDLSGNILMRSSSMQKFRNDTTGQMLDLVFHDNLIIEGEVGISLGGNTDEPLRFIRPRVTRNVLIDIGRTHPTNRSLAWYFTIQDWDGGLVAENCFLHQQDPTIGNAFGISVGDGSTRDVLIRDNVIHGFIKGRGISIGKIDGPVTWLRNSVVFDSEEAMPISSRSTPAEDLQGHRWLDNRWVGADPDGSIASIDREDHDAASWATLSGEVGGRSDTPAYPDPDRTVESYCASLGHPATMEAFVTLVRAQSRRSWDPAFTATAVNDYLRAGFAVADDRPRRAIRVELQGIEATDDWRAILDQGLIGETDGDGSHRFPGLSPRQASRIHFELDPRMSNDS